MILMMLSGAAGGGGGLIQDYDFVAVTPTFAANISIPTDVDTNSPLGFSSDGTYCFFRQVTTRDIIRAYPLSTPGDLTTIGPLSSTLDMSTFTGSIDRCFSFRLLNSGQTLYVSQDTYNNICEFTLSTPYDLSTAGSFRTNAATADTISYPADDGSHILLNKFVSAEMREFAMTTALDLSAGGTESAATSTGLSQYYGGIYSSDGTRMWLSNYSTNRVTQYTLSTPYDVSTLSVDTTWTPSGLLGSCYGFMACGNYIYILDSGLSGGSWKQYTYA